MRDGREDRGDCSEGKVEASGAMESRAKLRIDDHDGRRAELETLAAQATQVTLDRWALELAKHALALAGFAWSGCAVVGEGFAISEAWQRGEARVCDVRRASLAVHRLAKACSDRVVQAALRTAGHAIATGHLRGHAMVASDYAVRTVNLLHPDDLRAAAAERDWQLRTLHRSLADEQGTV